MISRLLLLPCLLAAACGTPPISTDGQVDGVELSLGDALLRHELASDSIHGVTQIVARHAEQFCADASVANPMNNETFLFVTLGVIAPDGVLVPPNSAGKFLLGQVQAAVGSKLAGIEYLRLDQCRLGAAVPAIAGSVELTHAVTGPDGKLTQAVGRFEATFQDSSHVTGEFSVGACEAARLAVYACR